MLAFRPFFQAHNMWLRDRHQIYEYLIFASSRSLLLQQDP